MSPAAARQFIDDLEPPFTAWAEETDAYRPACLRLAWALLRDEHMAEDAVQEAFFAAWQHQGRFDPAKSSQRSWLLMITRRRAVDRVRAEQCQRDERLVVTEQQLLDESGRISPTDPSEAVIRAELGETVRAAMVTLPALQRETLTLAYWGGYTQREIAQLMNCPLGTVKTRCLTGMRSLRLALESASALDRKVA